MKCSENVRPFMEKRDSVYIRHILDSIEKIEVYIADRPREYFLEDSMLQGAVIYQLLIIGEAARAVSRELQAMHPDVPWRLMIGMRNKLIHDYIETDMEAVWEAASRDIPALKDALKNL